MRSVVCQQTYVGTYARTERSRCLSSWPFPIGSVCVVQNECVFAYIGVCDRKGALRAMKSSSSGASCSRKRERELEAHGVLESTGLVQTLRNFLISLSLWMNPDQANTVVIRGKRNDFLEALVQAAFRKVATFVGLQNMYRLYVAFICILRKMEIIA